MLIQGGKISSGRSINLIRRRRILQQLHDLIAEHHLARGGGNILPDDETVSRLADGKLAMAALDIGQEIVQPLDQILAIGSDGGLEHIGVGQGEIGGGQRVGELAGIKGDPAALLLVQRRGDCPPSPAWRWR